jgi:hypothetical protein
MNHPMSGIRLFDVPLQKPENADLDMQVFELSD